jgi:hypothetical protein
MIFSLLWGFFQDFYGQIFMGLVDRIFLVNGEREQGVKFNGWMITWEKNTLLIDYLISFSGSF